MKYLSIATLCITLTSACNMFAMEENNHRPILRNRENDTIRKDTRNQMCIETTRQDAARLLHQCEHELEQAKLVRNHVRITNRQDPIAQRCIQKEDQKNVVKCVLKDFNRAIAQNNASHTEALVEAHRGIQILLGYDDKIMVDPTFANDLQWVFRPSLSNTNSK
jgi:hypothetical protein